MSMELKVKEFTLPEVVEFNFEELKEAVSVIAKKYENHIYTEGQMTEAKKDLANLRKFVKALNDERLRLEREYMKPFQDFKDKINELISCINEPIMSIDKQAKFFDEQVKENKKLQIASFFEGCSPFEWLKVEQIFNPKWLNATVKIPTIEKEIEETIQSIRKALDTLENLPEFSFEATKVYKDTLDINKAISEGKRLSDIQKRKAEAEAETKAEDVSQIPSDNAPDVSSPLPPVEDVNKQWVSFKALLSTEDAVALKQLFDDRNIVFEKI